MDQTELDEQEQKAIQAALENNWDGAILHNQQILSEKPDDINALNRIALAFTQKGEAKQSQKCYRKVLRFDPYNSIAKKNLKYFTESMPSPNISQINPNLFLEEPGKTKIISLYTVEKDNLKEVRVGDALTIKLQDHAVSLLSASGKPVGEFENNFSQYFNRLIRMGNKYLAFLLSVDDEKPKIFIREVKKNPKYAHLISFPATGNRQYHSFLREDFLSLLSDQQDIISPTEEIYDTKKTGNELSTDSESAGFETPEDENNEKPQAPDGIDEQYD